MSTKTEPGPFDAMARAVGDLDYITETDGPGIGYQRAQLAAWIAENCK